MTPEQWSVVVDKVVPSAITATAGICGGIVGWLSAFTVARVQRNTELKKYEIQDRRRLLLEVAGQICEFEERASSFATTLLNCRRGAAHKTPADIVAARDALNAASISMRRARTTLRVLALKTAEANLEDYLKEIRRVFAAGEQLDIPQLEKLVIDIRTGPIAVTEEVARQFRRYAPAE